MSVTDECVPATYRQKHKRGQVITCRHVGKHTARRTLIERDGPPPFPDAICRHLCKNDSTAPNGWVCVKHIVWGTPTENAQDKDPEIRKRVAAAGGKVGGKILPWPKEASVAGQKASQKVQLKEGTQVCLQTYVCPHCGKVGKSMVMKRHHFDRCKLISSTSFPCNANAYD